MVASPVIEHYGAGEFLAGGGCWGKEERRVGRGAG
jgi:hypothetical protein